MAYQLVLSLPTPATVPTDGWLVGYKILGSPGAYTLAGPFMSMPITIPTADAVGTLYEGYITRDCGDLTSTDFFWQTPCNCVGAGYVESPSGLECENVETTEPHITNSGYCLAASQNSAYTSSGTRIYNPGFITATMNINFGTPDAFINQDVSTAGQWANPGASTTIGPLNREGVWIDSNCDGTRNPLGDTITGLTNLVAGTGYTNGTYNDVPFTGGSGLGATGNITISGGVVTSVVLVQGGNQYVISDTLGVNPVDVGGTGLGFSIDVDTVAPQQTTLAYVYNNPDPSKTIYVGAGADNQFQLVVNGTQIADTGIIGDKQYRIWHIMPITVVTGPNYINLIGTGDGSVDDSLGMVVYENTIAEIAAATTDLDLDIPFASSSLRGTTFETATCPITYSLDTSGGTGNYICVKTTYKSCNTLV